MGDIIQGDSGSILELTIADDGKIVDIRGATISVVIQYRNNKTIKQATVTDGANGKCEVTLTSSDVAESGMYAFQITITFSNGNEFSSNIDRFNVTKKLK